jgi:glycosyltransferase involved in cell wall biosynthesis
MLSTPLVSVICTCFNHEKYVFEALNSVVNQTYSNIELFIIDNGSKDNSVEVIQNWLWLHDYFTSVKTYYHADTRNYCQVFNEALRKCKGTFVVDLAADDVLCPSHLDIAVSSLEASQAGVYFSNAILLDERGRSRTFYSLDKNGSLKDSVPQGDMYRHLVEKYVVCSATLVFRTFILLKENGYDESLSYEDFDIMVRLGRKYKFIFNNSIGVEKRLLRTSFSAGQYRVKNSIMLPSTYQVLKKINRMNRTEEEHMALINRSLHEIKHALASANFDIAGEMLAFVYELGGRSKRFWFYWGWWRLRFNVSRLYVAFTRR